MFGKLAADALGLSDVGSVIRPQDYDKVDSDDYVMHEDGEKIFFLIKSKSDEYCFTNLGLIHLDGTSAMSKKRMLKRYNYATNHVSSVLLETAGTVDLDVEVKFNIGSNNFSIDVHKKHIEEVKDLYKALLKIGEIQHELQTQTTYAERSLDVAVNTLSRVTKADVNLAEQFEKVNNYAFNWYQTTRENYYRKDFGDVFERYIKN